MHTFRIAALLPLLASAAPSQQPPPLPPAKIDQNYAVSGQPWDIAITPDGTKAIVQTVGSGPGATAGKMYVLDLEQSTGSPTWTSMETDLGLGGTRLVAALNDHAIAAPFLAGSPSGDAVKVRILKNLGDQPVVGEHTLSDLGWDVLARTSDAGTPIGVVRVDGTTFAYDLDAPTSPSLYSSPEPRLASSPLTHTWSQPMARSIAASTARFITAANLTLPGGGASVVQNQHGLVAIHNLETGTMLAKHGFKCDPNSGLPSACVGDPNATGLKLQHLHGVTVTPDGQFGIVSGWGVIGVYKLVDGFEVARFEDYFGSETSNTLPRQTFLSGLVTNRHTHRSVVASNDYAVVVGHDSTGYGSPTTDNSTWRVAVVKLDGGSNVEVAAHTDMGGPVTNYCGYGTTQLALTPGRAHDVALSPNGKYAVVSIRRPETLVIPLIGSSAHTSPPLEYCTDVDPLSHANPFNYWIATSVAVTNSRAVVIGTDSAGVGRVDVIDLDKRPSRPDAVVSISLGAYRPTDVSVSKLENRAVIRSILQNTSVGTATAGKITVVDVSERTLLKEFTVRSGVNPNLGYGWGLNHAEAGDTLAVTGGQDNATGAGFVQIVDMVTEEVQ